MELALNFSLVVTYLKKLGQLIRLLRKENDDNSRVDAAEILVLNFVHCQRFHHPDDDVCL